MAFHDTGRRGRVPTITDYHGYDIAVLGERGCALASPGSKEGGAATVFYRPYESWAHAPEWRVALPKGERAVSVAAGDAFVAVVTSERLLRVFTHAGAQKHIVQLEGAPVTCAAKGDSLVVVWHAGAPQTEQRLAYAEYDVGDDGAVVSRGALPLAPGSTLTWLGFCETGAGAAGAIAYASSDGVVRVRTPAFGGSFAPVFRSADARAQEGEHHWPVAVSVADDVNGACAGFYAVVCRDADGPAVHPKPVLTPMPLSHPVALPEGSAGELEDVASRARLAAALAAAAAEKERARRGDVSGASADALREAHAASDKASLRLFHAACKAERPARAADVAAMLHLSSSMHGALKLANALQQGALAQRVTSLIEASMAAAAAEAAAAREPAYYEHPSQLETPGQDRGAYDAAPAPAARVGAADDDANPFSRRKSSSAEKRAPAKENDVSASAGDFDSAAAPGVLKSKAGFERDISAAPPSKKSRAANPFARK
jgi:chromosome transmission fidelity protein 4